MKARRWLLIVLLSIALLATTVLPIVQAAPKRGGTLTIIIAEDVRHLDIIFDGGTEGRYVNNQVTDGLVNTDRFGKIVPALAESWTVSADGTVYTFKLRRNVKFHDGTDFDASDVKWNYDRLLDPKISYAAARYRTFIKTVEILDSFTVRITTPGPNPDFMPLMAAGRETDIHSPEAVQKWGRDYGIRAIVGTGPFRFKEWIKAERLVLIRNENYWKPGLPYLDSIVYRPMPEESLRVVTLRARQADVALDPALADVAKLKSDERFKIMTYPGGTLNLIYFNTTKKPFDDLRVRQALYYGIDRKAIAEAVFYGYAEPGSGVFPSWHWAHDKKWERSVFPYNPQRARELLAQAGFTEQKPLEFTLTTSDASEYVDQATLVQNQLAKVGVRVKVLPLDKSALTASQNPPRGQLPTFEVGLYRLKKGNLTSDYTWRSYAAESPTQLTWYNRPSGYQDPEVAKLMDDALTIVDKEKALAINRRISEIAIQDATRIVLSYVQNVNLLWDYVEGMGIDVLDDFAMETVWLNK